MWLLEIPDASFDAELLKKLVERICRISAYEINWGNRVHTMDDHVFLTVFALIISAVLERDFPETVTVTEVTYSILRLLRYFCISHSKTRKRHRKSPSSSTKWDGQLHDRS